MANGGDLMGGPDLDPTSWKLLATYWAWALGFYAIMSLVVAALAAAQLRGGPKSVGLKSFTLPMPKKVDPKSLLRVSLLTGSKSSLLDRESFQDPEMEKKFKDEQYDYTMRNGSLFIALWVGLMALYRSARNMYFRTPDKTVGLIEFCEYIGIICTLFCTVVCRLYPKPVVYWPLVLIVSAYVLASVLPPLQWGCTDLLMLEIRLHNCTTDKPPEWQIEAVKNQDCSPTAITATLLYMTWILLLPWLVYGLEMIHLAWFWILTYIMWTVLYSHFHATWMFNWKDVLGRTSALAATLLIASVKKSYLETSSIKKFFAAQEMKRASERIFGVFQYMVPAHVVVPMLKHPGKPIADPVDKVTIMFIIIEDFEELASKSTPEDLLSFLNRHFSEMDAICTANRVTKIETVGEEYVACVGVVPEDIAEAKAHGHQGILTRLFQAGSEILDLQSDELKLKIGVHTGSIVAGVIGNKLPRYRLFGDTINTAARMMQKGKPGYLQFGEATQKELPENVAVSYRGEVEMKGKGLVKAWLFEKMKDDENEQDDLPCRMMSTRSSRGQGYHEFDHELFQAVTKSLESAVVSEGSDQAFSLFTVFTHEAEHRWFKEFHEKTFMKKFVVRLTRQIYLLSVMTLFELFFISFIIIHYGRPLGGTPVGTDCKDELVCHDPRWVTGDDPYLTVCHANSTGVPLCFHKGGAFLPAVKACVPFVEEGWSYLVRIPIYLGCRLLSIALVLKWRHAYLQWNDWMMNSAVAVQNAMMGTTCVILLLTFISHNILTLHAAKGSKREGAEGHDARDGPPLDQLFLPLFVLAYYLLSTIHAFRFWPSLWFIPLACGFMILCSEEGLGTLFFSFSGKILFISNSVLNVFLAYNEEGNSRKRFQASAVVDETRNRTETILRTLMPSMVVDQLRANPGIAPSHKYNKCCIQQSDLCGFTKLAATRTPREVVDFISELFGMFDVLTDKYGIYKVETIGDAYIAGQAEKPMTKENRPSSVIRFGLESVLAVNRWSKKLGGEPVGCRVGIHYGECIGGVVGTDMQRYHLFGGLMTVLEVMESCGVQSKVHVSTAAYNAFREQMKDDPDSELQFAPRTDEDLRTSKGEAHTYKEAGGPTWFASLR